MDLGKTTFTRVTKQTEITFVFSLEEENHQGLNS